MQFYTAACIPRCHALLHALHGAIADCFSSVVCFRHRRTCTASALTLTLNFEVNRSSLVPLSEQSVCSFAAFTERFAASKPFAYKPKRFAFKQLKRLKILNSVKCLF